MKTSTIVNKKGEKQDELDAQDHETMALTIDPEGAEHLMHTLSNLYSKPVESVWREVINNALDAHIEAEQTRPIEITLNKTEFIVQDYGVGMSKDDIDKVYRKYAASTKRDNNKQNGAFGFGAKSPLAIVSRFDVTSVKDGEEYKFYIQKNSHGVGVVHTISHTKTGLPNGVKVTIPLDTELHNRFESFPNHWFQYWKPGTALVNDKPVGTYNNVHDIKSYIPIYNGEEVIAWVSHKPTGHVRWNDSIFSKLPINVGGTRYDLQKFVQGASKRKLVPYNNNSNYLSDEQALYNEWVKDGGFLEELVRYGYEIIVNIPIGSIDFVPSREEVMETSKTKTTLTTAWQMLKTLIPETFKKHINTLRRQEALKFAAENLPAFGIRSNGKRGHEYQPITDPNTNDIGIYYQGELIPIKVSLPDNSYVIDAINGSQWYNNEWLPAQELHLFASINRQVSRLYPSGNNGYPRNWNPFYSRVSRTNQPVIVYGEEPFDSIKMKPLLSNTRALLKEYENQLYPTIFYVQSKNQPEDKWLEATAIIIEITKLAEIAKEYRRALALEAAERKQAKPAQPNPNEVPFHYGAIYSNGSYSIRTFSPKELETLDVIILQEQNSLGYSEESYIDWNLNLNYKTGARFWGKYTYEFFKKNPSYEQGSFLAIKRASRIFENKLVIFVPKSRSVGPIQKQANSSQFFYEAISELLISMKKTQPKDYKILQLLADIEWNFDRNYSSPPILTYVNTSDAEALITDPTALSLYKEIRSEQGLLRSIIEAGKTFLPLDGTQYKRINPDFNWASLYDVFGSQGGGSGKSNAVLLDAITFDSNRSIRDKNRNIVDVSRLQATIFNQIISKGI